MVPEALIHIDVNREVFDRNFKAKVSIEGDAKCVVPRLREKLEGRGLDGAARRTEVAARIAADKQGYRRWAAHLNERVNPSLFFEELRKQVADQDIMVVDDGNHTYLAAELFEVRAPRTFISHRLQLHGVLRPGGHRRQAGQPRAPGGGDRR